MKQKMNKAKSNKNRINCVERRTKQKKGKWKRTVMVYLIKRENEEEKGKKGNVNTWREILREKNRIQKYTEE